MKISFSHEATTSFSLWFEHHLLEHGEAYDQKTGKLFYIDDDRLPNNYYRYSSPYKQWVNESGAGGAFVPTAISGAAGEIDKTNDINGYYIDFNNGGVVVTGNAASASLNLSGAFSVKEFNIYNTNQSEESLIVESKFDNNSRFTVVESGIAPYDFVTPAVFVNNEDIENIPYAFGGEDKTILSFKSVVFAENLYQLDGILSLFSDTRNVSFSAISFGDHPINEFGDLKSGLYLYNETAKKRSNDLFNIERVTTSKISENVRSSISPTLFVGFIDFEVTKNRFPRVC
jgi:hypothetical protein